MDTSLDLVDHFKLEAEQLPEYTQHTHYKSDRSHGLRRLKIVKRWRRKQDIGEGTFGIVWLEVEEDGTERAVKAISRRLCSYSKIDYKKELAAMAILSKYEELFVAFQGWFEGPDHIFVAMEYFKHGDLQRHMDSKMPEIQVKIVIAQILEGLKIMHQLGFTHRDLKPQNIFVVDTDPIFWVKIGDFGITKRIVNEQTFLRTQIGTPDYSAPEVLGYVEEETSRYTNAIDLWSLGCICYRLLTLEPPFPKMTALARYCLGMTELPIETLYKTTVSEEAITFVKDLMSAQPSERPNAEAALHSLWLKDVESLDSTFTVQSEASLPASTDKGLTVHDAGFAQNNKLRETSIATMKKKREEWYPETSLTTRNLSAETLRSAMEYQISDTESKQQEGSNLMSVTDSIPMSPSALREDDRDAASLKDFLDAGFDLENYNVGFQGYAVEAFEWAARQPKTNCLDLLLRNPPMIDVTESFYWAMRENVLIAVQAIVEATHIDINRPSYSGLTPLHVACMHGHEEIVRYLIKNGAHVNARDTSGMTPLHLVSLANCEANVPITVLLEEHGALEGYIPLARAPAISELMMSGPGADLARNRPKLQKNLSIEHIMTLQELPDDVLSGDECLAAHFRMTGHYPHVLALADHAFRWAAKEDSKDLMVYVLENGAPVDTTLLLQAAEIGGNSEAIALLEARRATTNPLYFFTNPLHTACFYGQLDAVIALLQGIPCIQKVLRSKDHRGETALHKALRGPREKKEGDRQQLVEMLVSLGADPTARDMRGETALSLAKVYSPDKTITTLKAAIKRWIESPPTPEDAFSEVETTETPADTTKVLWTNDELSSLGIYEGSFRDNTDRRLSHKAEKVEEHKRSRWRAWLMPEVKRRDQGAARPPLPPVAARRPSAGNMVVGNLDLKTSDRYA